WRQSWCSRARSTGTGPHRAPLEGSASQPRAGALHVRDVRAVAGDLGVSLAGVQLDVGAVWLHAPGVARVLELHHEVLPPPLAKVTHLDVRHRLDAAREIAVHPVRRADVDLAVRR